MDAVLCLTFYLSPMRHENTVTISSEIYKSLVPPYSFFELNVRTLVHEQIVANVANGFPSFATQTRKDASEGVVDRTTESPG
jgi:hypothetical protein